MPFVPELVAGRALLPVRTIIEEQLLTVNCQF
jgi:hypothetical protein